MKIGRFNNDGFCSLFAIGCLSGLFCWSASQKRVCFTYPAGMFPVNKSLYARIDCHSSLQHVQIYWTGLLFSLYSSQCEGNLLGWFTVFLYCFFFPYFFLAGNHSEYCESFCSNRFRSLWQLAFFHQRDEKCCGNWRVGSTASPSEGTRTIARHIPCYHFSWNGELFCRQKIGRCRLSFSFESESVLSCCESHYWCRCLVRTLNTGVISITILHYCYGDIAYCNCLLQTWQFDH